MKVWYLVPAPDYYQFCTIYIPTTRTEITIKTVELFTHYCPVPKISSTDAARQRVEYLMEALSNPDPASPL